MNLNEISDELPTIFYYLDTTSFVRSARVCKKWNNFANDSKLWEKIIINELNFKEYRVFGPKEWQKVFNIPTPLTYPKNLCHELDKPSPFFPGKTVGETSFVQSKVEEIQTCAHLVTLNGARKYSKITKDVANEVSLGKADWYIIPDTTIPHSISKTLKEQTSLINVDPSYRIASIFETSLVIFSQYSSTNKAMLDNNPALYTRSRSTMYPNKSFIVGGYTNSGLAVLKLDKTIRARNTGIIPLKELF